MEDGGHEMDVAMSRYVKDDNVRLWLVPSRGRITGSMYVFGWFLHQEATLQTQSLPVKKNKTQLIEYQYRYCIIIPKFIY